MGDEMKFKKSNIFSVVGLLSAMMFSSSGAQDASSGNPALTAYPNVSAANLVDLKIITDDLKFDPGHVLTIPEAVKKVIDKIVQEQCDEAPSDFTTWALKNPNQGFSVFRIKTKDAFKGKDLYVLRSDPFNPSYSYFLIFYDPKSEICYEPFPLFDYGTNWLHGGFEDLLGDGQKYLKIEMWQKSSMGMGASIVEYFFPGPKFTCEVKYGYVDLIRRQTGDEGGNLNFNRPLLNQVPKRTLKREIEEFKLDQFKEYIGNLF